MKSRILLVSAVLAPIAWFGACANTVPRGEDGVTAVQFKDMVVPAGMRLIDGAHESHSVETSGWRQGRFVYSGNVKPEDAAAYVRERMPQHNWRLVVDETKKGDPPTTKLRFTRGYYVTEYNFARENGRTQLVIEYDTDYSAR